MGFLFGASEMTEKKCNCCCCGCQRQPINNTKEEPTQNSSALDTISKTAITSLAIFGAYKLLDDE